MLCSPFPTKPFYDGGILKATPPFNPTRYRLLLHISKTPSRNYSNLRQYGRRYRKKGQLRTQTPVMPEEPAPVQVWLIYLSTIDINNQLLLSGRDI